MSISVSCESCGKAYKVEDRFAGKKAKCRSCGAMMNIPPTSASVEKPATAVAAARPVSAAPARAKSRPPAQKSAAPDHDPFSSDIDLNSLENLETTGVVDQAAYAPVSRVEARQRAAELSNTVAGELPPSRGTTYAEAKARRGGLPAKSALMDGVQSLGAQLSLKSFIPNNAMGWVWVIIVLAGLIGLLSRQMAAFGGLGLLLIGAIFLFYGLIQPGILARREDLTCWLLYRYLPGYQIYFIISRWEETSRCVLNVIQGFVLLMLGAALILAVGFRMRFGPPSHTVRVLRTIKPPVMTKTRCILPFEPRV